MRDAEPIRTALRMRPFRPFSLKLADGSEHDIDHPDWISIPPVPRPREVTVYEIHGGDEDDMYSTHWIDLGLIVQVIAPGWHEVRRPEAPPAAD